MYKFTLLITILAALLVVKIAPAQNAIPNNDFENWTGNNPNSWDTSNENILGLNFICVTREATNPQNGQYSAKIQSVSQNIIFVGTVTMPGIMTLGNVVIDIANQTGTVEGGVPVSGYPKFLKGYYKYQPTGVDSCIVGIGLTRWNGLNRDTIAYAYTKFGGNVTQWQQFTLPIEYETFVEPDTMNIMFVSSDILSGTINGGSTLRVDNLWLEYSEVAISNIDFDKRVYVYEVGDGNSVVVNSGEDKIQRILLYNINGHLLKSKSDCNNKECNISLSELPSGYYLIRVLFADGESKTLKFRRL
jgi:hypothetical protein